MIITFWQEKEGVYVGVVPTRIKIHPYPPSDIMINYSHVYQQIIRTSKIFKSIFLARVHICRYFQPVTTLNHIWNNHKLASMICIRNQNHVFSSCLLPEEERGRSDACGHCPHRELGRDYLDHAYIQPPSEPCFFISTILNPCVKPI